MLFEIRYLVRENGCPTMGRKFTTDPKEAERLCKEIERHGGQAMISAYEEARK